MVLFLGRLHHRIPVGSLVGVWEIEHVTFAVATAGRPRHLVCYIDGWSGFVQTRYVAEDHFREPKILNSICLFAWLTSLCGVTNCGLDAKRLNIVICPCQMLDNGDVPVNNTDMTIM